MAYICVVVVVFRFQSFTLIPCRYIECDQLPQDEPVTTEISIHIYFIGGLQWKEIKRMETNGYTQATRYLSWLSWLLSPSSSHSGK